MKNRLARKITAVSLAVSMLGLSACGSTATEVPEETTKEAESPQSDTAVVEAENKTGEGETVTIGIWSEDEKKRLEVAFADVEESIGIKVEFLQYPSDSDF